MRQISPTVSRQIGSWNCGGFFCSVIFRLSVSSESVPICRACDGVSSTCAVRSFQAVSREAVKNRLYCVWAVPPCREYHRAEKTPRSTEKLRRAWCCVTFHRCRCPLSLCFSPSVARSRSRWYNSTPEKLQAVKSVFRALQEAKRKAASCKACRRCFFPFKIP